uniref:UDENN domain-containing protein n=1 Tax=Ascaris lumbricoides TaxID=6252 RepID=A0A0M3I1F7_ASCLU
MLACHAGGPGPIPGRRNMLTLAFSASQRSDDFIRCEAFEEEGLKQEQRKFPSLFTFRPEREAVFVRRMLACHAGGPGPIPGQRNMLTLAFSASQPSDDFVRSEVFEEKRLMQEQ